MMQLANRTAPCRKEINQTHTEVNQAKLVPDDEHGPVMIYILVIGLGNTACLGICLGMLSKKIAEYQQRKRHLETCQITCQMQKLLKAKIDAWSYFDLSLKAQMSKLEPSFLHCLGLHCS